MSIENLPGNTLTSRTAKPAAKEVKKVTPVELKGSVSTKKPPANKRWASAIFAEDAKNIGDYLLWDVLIPSAKNLLVEMGKSAIDMAFNGQRRSPGFTQMRGTSVQSQHNYRAYNKVGVPVTSHINPAYSNRANTLFEDVILENRGDAEYVLEQLCNILAEYGQTTVADLYELVGLPTDSPYTQQYGWENLSRATVDTCRTGGYLINLPKPHRM